MRPKSFNSGKPTLPPVHEFVEVTLGVADPDFGNCCRITFAHLGIAGLRPPCHGSGDAGPRPLADERPLELRKRAQHLGHQHALRARSIDWFVDRAKVGALRPQYLDDLQQVGKRPCQSVYPDNQKSIARSNPFQRASKVRSFLAGTACLVFENDCAPLATQSIMLRGGILLVGGNAGVANLGHLSHIM